MELPQHVPLVVATRGEAVESVHCGSVAVADATGRVLAAAGDVAFPVFTRSTLKPFQALPFVAEGGPTRFGFTRGQVALLCASHSGEPRHTAAVADMLARVGCSAADLQCGCHLPLYYAATGAPVPPDLTLSPLQHNCSGKHAGFLAWCRQHDEPMGDYLEPQHPLQREVRRMLALFVGCAEAELPSGIDGCGAPNYALPLSRLAIAYARLASGANGDERLAALFAAMTGEPEMVAGEARGDLILMRAAPGDWVAKAGAEGVQALGIASRGVGIALKVGDGDPRALRVALIAVLRQLDLMPPSAAAALRRWADADIRNHAGRLTGRLQPVFELAPPDTAPMGSAAAGP